jgi:hypothetical protein
MRIQQGIQQDRLSSPRIINNLETKTNKLLWRRERREREKGWLNPEEKGI